MLQVVFLGTGAAVPTKNRGLSSVVVKRAGEILMFDCGEGTQRQMVSAGIGLCRKMKIFITHLHGDHIFGLTGLLQSMSLLGRTRELYVYGPTGLGEYLDAVSRTARLHTVFPVEAREIKEGKVYEDREYEIQAAPADHVVECFAYALVEKEKPGRFYLGKAKALRIPEGPLWRRLQLGETVSVGGRKVEPRMVLGSPRPGVKIVYALDSRPCDHIRKLAMKADLLIHDGSFDDSLIEKAISDGHSTASQAAEVAKKAKVKRLVLTHLSARYENPKLILSQAKKIFPKSIVASDFLSLEVSASAK